MHKPKQQWSWKTKAVALALSVSMLPVLIVGIGSYLLWDLNYRQLLERQGLTVENTEIVLKRYQRFVLNSTILAALLGGGIAGLMANRAVRRVINATEAATSLVNRLTREETSTQATMGGKDELVVLETNLRVIEAQLPELLWKQEAVAARSELLMNISHRIWGSRSSEDVLRTAVEEIRQAFKANRVIVFRFLPNWDGTCIEESVAPGWPKMLWSTIHDPCFGLEYAEKYHQGRVNAIGDIYRAGLSDCYIGLLERFAVKANLVAPIITDNELYGLLIAHQCSGARFWQQPEMDLFGQLAAQVGFALEHVKLLEQLDTEATQLQVLIYITRRIRESLNEEDILKTTVEEIRKALRTDRVIVFGFDAHWNGTVIAESVLPGFPKAMRANIEDPCFTTGYVEQYQAGRVRAINNIYEAGLTSCYIHQLELFAVRANLVAPILKDDKLFGLLIAHQCSKPRNWEQVEIDLFAQLAAQVGFALDHARLLNHVDQAYQTAETSCIQQRLQTEALQRQMSEQLSKPSLAMKALAVDASSQIKSIQAAQSYIQPVVDLAEKIEANIEQVKLYREQLSWELLAGYETIIQVVDAVVAIQQVIVEAALKLKHIEETSNKLLTRVAFVENVVSELNLEAMNAALAATRSTKAEQQHAPIAKKVLTSTQELKGSIAKIQELVMLLQAEIQEVIKVNEIGGEKVTSGTQLVETTRQQINSVNTLNTQMNLLFEEIAQAANNQIQNSSAANQIVLEVVSVIHHASEQFMVVVESFNKLAAATQEFPPDVN
jgi:GAF domain-containing protein